MTGTTTRPKPILLSAEPQLFTADIKASCDFYRKLGFSIAFTYGEPAFYAQVRRDGVSLNLRHLDAPVLNSELRLEEQLLSASITVDDVASLYAEFLRAGVEMADPLKGAEWGARTFLVSDPGGNLILFAGSQTPATV